MLISRTFSPRFVSGKLEAIGKEGFGFYDPCAGAQVLFVYDSDRRSRGEVGPAIGLVDTVGEERARGAVSDEYTPIGLLLGVQERLFSTQQK